MVEKVVSIDVHLNVSYLNIQIHGYALRSLIQYNGWNEWICNWILRPSANSNIKQRMNENTRVFTFSVSNTITWNSLILVAHNIGRFGSVTTQFQLLLSWWLIDKLNTYYLNTHYTRASCLFDSEALPNAYSQFPIPLLIILTISTVKCVACELFTRIIILRARALNTTRRHNIEIPHGNTWCSALKCISSSRANTQI